MKKSNVAICVALIALICVGWVTQIGNLSKTQSAYNDHLEQAEAYQEKSLYQKAIEAYESALAIRETEKVRDLWLDAYRGAYEDGVTTAKKYGSAILTACELYPDNDSYWERLLSFYLETGSYTSAYESYQKCLKAGAGSDALTELSNQIRYSYNQTKKVYMEFIRSPYGGFVVRDTFGWGVVNGAGEAVASCDYLFISPANSEGEMLYVTDKDARLTDEDGVVEAILTEQVTKAGSYGDGLIPVRAEDGTWQYLDCESGEYMEAVYDSASGYCDGIAAVRNGEQWVLIDTDGEEVSKTDFDDVKLHGNGDYVYKDIMIASSDGEYGIYDEKGELQESLDCVDADIYLGGYIAFQDEDGLWGYVDKDGDVVIKPAYQGARSFSNGLAAVSDGTAWGFINEDGDLVIAYQFLEADYFTSGGVCFVSMVSDQYYLIKLRFVED